ncbi:hypothetical protein [Streptomyces sp. HPF1205]|uniref:hypothetical protein n=1 Tax=Streptomyces sp. HPF1205 TaxID=2873262 RepID=UPI001CEC4C98|nr:hypothetical protein [Streptomyces sp. HPF1205]
MTGAQARALTAPRPARPDLAAVRRITEANFTTGRYRRVGAGKTSTARGLSTAVALAFAQRAGMMDPDGAAPATARLLAAAGGRRPLLTDTEPPATSHQTLAPLLLGDASSPLAWSDERRLSRATHHPGEG